MATPNKTIVISDLHISNGAAYSWFLPPYPDCLAAMLSQVAKDPEVEQLVIMGDMFDLWLYPINIVPWSVAQILDDNPGITQALRACVANLPAVYYMLGNHDMQVTASDLTPLENGGKSVRLVPPEWYNGKYGNARHLEHGNAADVFNAPDNSGDTIGGYPLGFFITRLVASASNQGTLWHELQQLLENIFGDHKSLMALSHERLDAKLSMVVGTIIKLLAMLAGVPENTPIRFREPQLDNKYTVGDIQNYYGSLFLTWFLRYPNPKEFFSALLAGFLSDGLNWYGNILLAQKPTPQFVALGHTHHALTEGSYDNDGCWCIPGSLGHGDATPYYLSIVGETPTLNSWPCT
jgi:UDP-2,3-diacylglucosamine pyrophosphatase LpxH